MKSQNVEDSFEWCFKMFLSPSENTGHHVTPWFMTRYNNHEKKTIVNFPGGDSLLPGELWGAASVTEQ